MGQPDPGTPGQGGSFGGLARALGARVTFCGICLWHLAVGICWLCGADFGGD